MEELETNQVESDAIEPSSEAQDLPEKENISPDAAKAAGGEQPDQDDQKTPFHKHPRWIERDNELKAEREARQALEQRYSQLESQIKSLSEPKAPAAPDKRAAMIERLKGIDPEFAEFISELAPREDVKQVQERYQQMEQQAFVQRAVGTIKELHTKNNVSPELQARYEKELDIAYRTGQIRNMDDVQKTYKAVHEDYSKMLESIKRAERESYVAAKKADTKLPSSQPKGKAAPNAAKGEWSKDPAEARNQLISQVLKRARASDSL